MQKLKNKTKSKPNYNCEKNVKETKTKQNTKNRRNYMGGSGDEMCSKKCFLDITKILLYGEKQEFKKAISKIFFSNLQINQLFIIAINELQNEELISKTTIILNRVNDMYKNDYVRIFLNDVIFDKILNNKNEELFNNYKMLKLFIIKGGNVLGTSDEIINKILDHTSFTQRQRKNLASIIMNDWFMYTKDDTNIRLKNIIKEKSIEPEQSKLSKIVKKVSTIFNKSKKTDEVKIFPPKPEKLSDEKYEKAKLLSILRLQQDKQDDPWIFQKNRKKYLRKTSPLRRELKRK